MQKNQLNLQDGFLNMVRKENIPVTIYLMGGYQLRGIVKGFDNFTIILDAEGKGEPKYYQTMVYKHAITTISPQRSINFNFTQENA